jgi:hypothetical protein
MLAKTISQIIGSYLNRTPDQYVFTQPVHTRKSRAEREVFQNIAEKLQQ